VMQESSPVPQPVLSPLTAAAIFLGDLLFHIRSELVGGTDPEFAGGSYVIVQKYVYDLDAWNALFFVPSADFLDDLPGPPGIDDLPHPSGTGSGSLGIGSLKSTRSERP
jgi:hypothetical protein